MSPCEIATTLSLNQIGALTEVARVRDWREVLAFRLAGGAPFVNAARQLAEMGLFELRPKRWWWQRLFDQELETAYRLTPLGTQVRDCLR